MPVNTQQEQEIIYLLFSFDWRFSLNNTFPIFKFLSCWPITKQLVFILFFNIKIFVM